VTTLEQQHERMLKHVEHQDAELTLTREERQKLQAEIPPPGILERLFRDVYEHMQRNSALSGVPIVTMPAAFTTEYSGRPATLMPTNVATREYAGLK